MHSTVATLRCLLVYPSTVHTILFLILLPRASGRVPQTRLTSCTPQWEHHTLGFQPRVRSWRLPPCSWQSPSNESCFRHLSREHVRLLRLAAPAPGFERSTPAGTHSSAARVGARAFSDGDVDGRYCP